MPGIANGILKLALLLAMAVPAFFTQTASARQATEAEKAGLSAAVERFITDMKALDFGAVSKTVPPAIMAEVAKSQGVSVATLEASIAAMARQAFEQVRLIDFSMDFAGVDYLELPDGEPYALIPMDLTLQVPNVGKVRTQSSTLGMLDEGRWYLVRVDESAQVNMLKRVYPSFAQVDFPAPRVEKVGE